MRMVVLPDPRFPKNTYVVSMMTSTWTMSRHRRDRAGCNRQGEEMLARMVGWGVIARISSLDYFFASVQT